MLKNILLYITEHTVKQFLEVYSIKSASLAEKQIDIIQVYILYSLMSWQAHAWLHQPVARAYADSHYMQLSI